MNATERRTLRCMYIVSQNLVQGPVNWTVTSAGAVQWFVAQATVTSLVNLGMITVGNGVGQLTSAGIAQASSDPIAWDGQC